MHASRPALGRLRGYATSGMSGTIDGGGGGLSTGSAMVRPVTRWGVWSLSLELHQPRPKGDRGVKPGSLRDQRFLQVSRGIDGLLEGLIVSAAR